MTPQVQLERPAGFWPAIREAIAGTHQDYTSGRIDKAIALLAIPMVLEMLMESLFGVVDVFWVAHLGADAVATVGYTETCLTILFAIAIGLSTGATATVARRIGEKDPRAASIAAAQAILVALALSAVFAVAGYFYAPSLLRIMGASDHVVAIGSAYTRTMLGGSATVFLLFLINAVFRGAGDAAMAMRVLWIANFVNICLNPLLIFGVGPFPRLGLAGSATGTTIGRGIGVLFQLWALFSGRGCITVRSLTPDFPAMWRLVRISLGGTFQYLIQTASWIGIIRIVAVFGSAAVAATTVAIKIIIFALLPSWGMSNAAATLVGQNLGARQPERAETSVWRTAVYNMLFLASVGAIFICFASPIVSVFTSEPAVVPIAVECLRFLSYGYISYAYGMVVTAAFNGAGDTVTPTVLNIICFWLFQIPLAYMLTFYTSLDVRGAYVAVVAGDSLLAITAIAWFRRGSWKRRTV